MAHNINGGSLARMIPGIAMSAQVIQRDKVGELPRIGQGGLHRSLERASPWPTTLRVTADGHEGHPCNLVEIPSGRCSALPRSEHSRTQHR
jgi:hypothetical protein